MKFKRILSFFFAVLFCFSLLVPSAFAAESAIEQELGNVISFADYPANPSDTGVYLITLMEKGYNGAAYEASSGIYVYLYNPSKKVFKSSSELHMMTFATRFASDGSLTGLEKYPITLIESARDGLFFKVKVNAKASDLAINSSGARHYAVSEIELFEDGHYNTNAQAYKCGYDFAFTGSGENLKCERTSFLVIDLNVKSTSYLTGDSGLGKNYSNMISSVYFSVPKAIEEKYGKLYSIDYEVYKYYTSPIVLIEKNMANDNRFYKNLLTYRGYSSENALVAFYIEKYKGVSTTSDVRVDWGKYVFSTTNWLGNYKAGVVEAARELPYYTTVFSVETLAPNTLVVSSDEVEEYFSKYSASFKSGCLRNGWSADLFKSVDGEHIRETRTRDEWASLPSYDEENGWFRGIIDYGIGYLGNRDKHDDIVNAKMIEMIETSDFGNSTFCEDFLVSEMDVEDLKSYVSEARANGNNTYLFRFAFDNDYYAAEGELSILSATTGGVKETVDINGVVMPVYLDFDIFELGFSDNGVDIVTFGVSSSPINSIADISTSDANKDKVVSSEIDWTWLKLLIAAFIGLFALYVIINVVNWFMPSKKKEEKVVIQVAQQTPPPKQYYSKPQRRRSRTSYRRGRRR